MSGNKPAAAVVGTLVLMTMWSCAQLYEPTVSSTPAAPAQVAAAPAPPPAPAWNPSARVATVYTPANIALTDGRLVHVPRMNMVLPYTGYNNPCERDADLVLARSLLQGRDVTVTPPKQSPDTPGLVPEGYVQADVEARGKDYAATFEARAFDHRREQCPPELASDTPSAGGSGTEDGGSVGYVSPEVDVDHGDTNHRDGTFTGGYCRRKWWC